MSPDGSGRFARSPAVPVVGAVAVGVLIDRLWNVPLVAWFGGALLLLLCAGAVMAFRRRDGRGTWLASVLVLAACLGVGGAWHHWCWSCRAGDDVSHWATDDGRHVRLIGRVTQAPVVRKVFGAERTPWRSAERTTLVIECQALVGKHQSRQPVSGGARLVIDGRHDAIAIGDVLEIVGRLALPGEPANPGEFDARRWLRGQRLHAAMTAEFVDSVRIIGRERTMADHLAVLRQKGRRRAELLIAEWLGPRTAPVAQSLLLGSRVDLDRNLRRSFSESGTLHVLAISGMNVGLLWGWLWVLCRVLRLSSRMTLLAVLVLLPMYAVLTDANPPVVRATLVAVLMAVGQLVGRSGSAWNSLALAALFVLAWNPSDLFNSGAQLSFLSVLAILATTGLIRQRREQAAMQENDLAQAGTRRRSALLAWCFGRRDGSTSMTESVMARWSQDVAAWLARALVESYVVTAAVWLVTSPLIASEFHVVSPIGFVLNVVLAPLVVVMFWLGYSFLLLGLVSSVVFGWIGVLFDHVLSWFLQIVQASARIDLGHVYVPAPAGWWLIGFYGLALSCGVIDFRKGRWFWAIRLLLGWTVLGLAVSLGSDKPKELHCTVLSVGHGLAVVIECPNGRRLLYDAGGMSEGDRVAQTIELALWTKGGSRLDGVIVSHADADHCNAVPELIDVVPTSHLFVHRTFLDWKQPAVSDVLDRAAAAGMELRLISTGQELAVDPDVSLRVLHPSPSFHSRADNPNSVVLCLEYAGRRIVLAGDLEQEGLASLLKTPHLDTDVLLAPHHGSMKANPNDLARWATPEWVIVSTGDTAVEDRLASRYGPSAEVVSTSQWGAICCRITESGELHIEPFKSKGVDAPK